MAATAADAPAGAETLPDLDQVHAHFLTLQRPGDVREVRVLEHVPASGFGGPATVSGYFDNVESLVEAVRGIGADHAAGVYITQNPVDSDLLARANNRLKRKPKQTTADGDIIRLAQFTADLDPVRKAGISATENELAAALAQRDAFIRFVTSELGWTEPDVVMMSGNGGQASWRIDLAADSDGAGLVAAALGAASRLFSTDGVSLDSTLGNPSRIVKLSGTWAGKGDPLPHRPHRRAKSTFQPEAGIVSAAQLRALVALAPAPVPEPRSPNGHRVLRAGGEPHDVPALLSAAGVGYAERDKPWGRVYSLDRCLSSEDHTDGAAIMQFPSGAVAYRCHHNRCHGITWQDVKPRLGIPTARHGEGSADRTAERGSSGGTGGGSQRNGAGPAGVLASVVQPERVSFLWPGRLAAGKPTMLDGDPGLGKSTAALDIAARITTGRPLPGCTASAEPRGVVLLSAEDGAADTIVPRLVANGADLGRVFIMQGVAVDGMIDPVTLPDALPAVEAAIRAQDAALLIVDPLMAYLGADTNAHRDQDVRRALAPLAALLDRTGCAGLLIRHLNKAQASAALYRGGGSIGIIGAARFGLLVARDPEDDAARILAPTKCNIGPEPPALRYRLEGVPDSDAARVVWDSEPVNVNAAGLLAATGDGEEERSALQEACDWLTDYLSLGARPASDIFKDARKDGHRDATLKRAKQRRGVQSQREGFGPGSRVVWFLPERPPYDGGADATIEDQGPKAQRSPDDEPVWANPRHDAGNASTIEDQNPIPSQSHENEPLWRNESVWSATTGRRCAEPKCGAPIPAGWIGHSCARHGGRPPDGADAALPAGCFQPDACRKRGAPCPYFIRDGRCPGESSSDDNSYAGGEDVIL